MKKILVLHGPNLNLLGMREQGIYGTMSLNQLNQELTTKAHACGFTLITQQSNSEGELINAIQSTISENIAYVILNPAGLTHTSVAMRDALLATDIPFVEVHISNTYAREAFRHRSLFSDIAKGVIIGFGPIGYFLALQAINELENTL